MKPAQGAPDFGAYDWGCSMVAEGSTPEFAFDTIKVQWARDGHQTPLTFTAADLPPFNYPPLKGEGVGYDAPPGGWPKASYSQEGVVDPKTDTRQFFITSSVGRGYFIDKATLDAMLPNVGPGWEDFGKHLLEGSNPPSTYPDKPPLQPVGGGGDPVIVEK